jgi:hypothetical protein
LPNNGKWINPLTFFPSSIFPPTFPGTKHSVSHNSSI